MAVGPGWRRLAALGAGSVVIAAGVAAGGPEPADGPPAATPAYLSGYDDHLLAAYETVPLYAEPGVGQLAEAPTDTLVLVHAVAGEWAEVSLAEPARLAAGAPRRGWVADFFLRGELHLVDPELPGCPVPAGADPARPDRQLDPSTKVRLVQLSPSGWVRVQPLREGGQWWVPRRVLSERPGPDVRRAAAGQGCEQIAPRAVPPHDHGRATAPRSP